MKRYTQLLKITFLLISILVFSCSKDDDNNTPPVIEPTVAIPVLSSISPTNGPKTTIVTINGANFDTDLNTTQVFFNKVEAVVQAITETQITAIVPPQAFTGLVKIISNGTELIGPEFNYIITEIQVSTIAGSDVGFADGTGTSAKFSYPSGITRDVQGNLYVADNSNHKIRKITPSGVVSTFAGSDSGYVNGTGSSAKFNFPYGIIIDAQGNLYVTDNRNHKIRKITPSGVVSTFAGSELGFENGTGTSAKFNYPYGITIDTQNNLYIADSHNHKIRKITPSGVVSTFAGSDSGYVNGTGTSAKFSYPTGIISDVQGNLYVADYNNHKIRKITPSGVVSTFAGSNYGFANGTGADAKFADLGEITIDAQGNLYVADTRNHKIRKITPSGVVSTFAGSELGFDNGIGAAAKFNAPVGITIDTQNNLYITDSSNHKIRMITQE